MENYDKALMRKFLKGKVWAHLKDKEEWDIFTTILEESTSLKWRGGQEPTGFYPSIEYFVPVDMEFWIAVSIWGETSVLVYGEYLRRDSLQKIEFSDFIILSNSKHYKETLREIPYGSLAIVDGKPKKCTYNKEDCKKCLFNGASSPEDSLKLYRKWCAQPYRELEKPLLDKMEHDYLAAVLAPKQMREGILGITKKEKDSSYYRILIWYQDPAKDFQLKPFKKSSKMYEGLEDGIVYPISKLGL